MAEHPVERRADLADLGRGVGVLRGDALGDVDLAAGQRHLGDADGGGGDPVQGAQLAAHEDRRRRGGEQQRGGRDHQLDDQVLVDGRGDGLQRQTGDGGVAPVRQHRDDAVLPEAGQLDGVDGAVGCEVEQRGGLGVRQRLDRPRVVEVPRLERDGVRALEQHHRADVLPGQDERRRHVVVRAAGPGAG